MKEGSSMKYFIITKRQIMWSVSGLLAVVIAVVGSVATFASNDRKLPIYCVETDKKQIAISFDAAWGNYDTEQLIDILKECDAPATVGTPHKYWGCGNSKLQKNNKF